MLKKIAIRVDSSVEIGSGHLMRCLTLAEKLRSNDICVFFITRELPGNCINVLVKHGFDVHKLPYNNESVLKHEKLTRYQSWLRVDWEVDAKQVSHLVQHIGNIDLLIVDHYGLDAQWELIIRSGVKRIMVIDDLANRKHACDILLDQNLYSNQHERYHNLISTSCLQLYGPKYVLLRDEFLQHRTFLHKDINNVARILIFLGGSDANNITEKVIKACIRLNKSGINFDVVVGSENPHKEKLQILCSKLPNFYYHCQIENMAELMRIADLSVGAGGAATWERCSLGLPTLVVSLGENDESFCQLFDAIGAQKYIGRACDVDEQSITNNLNTLISNKSARELMSRIAFDLIDGIGVNRLVSRLQVFFNLNKNDIEWENRIV